VNFAPTLVGALAISGLARYWAGFARPVKFTALFTSATLENACGKLIFVHRQLRETLR